LERNGGLPLGAVFLGGGMRSIARDRGGRGRGAHHHRTIRVFCPAARPAGNPRRWGSRVDGPAAGGGGFRIHCTGWNRCVLVVHSRKSGNLGCGLGRGGSRTPASCRENFRPGKGPRGHVFMVRFRSIVAWFPAGAALGGIPAPLPLSRDFAISAALRRPSGALGGAGRELRLPVARTSAPEKGPRGHVFMVRFRSVFAGFPAGAALGGVPAPLPPSRDFAISAALRRPSVARGGAGREPRLPVARTPAPGKGWRGHVFTARFRRIVAGPPGTARGWRSCLPFASQGSRDSRCVEA